MGDSDRLKRGEYCLDLYDDINFRAVLGDPDSVEALKGFLNAILSQTGEPRVKSVQVTNPFIIRDDESLKDVVLDIRVTDETGTQYDVEMQTTRSPELSKRFLYYWLRTYVDSLRSGRSYKELPRTRVIVLMRFPIESTRNVWFDEIVARSSCGTENRLDDFSIVYIRIPRENEEPTGLTRDLTNWTRLIAKYPKLSQEELQAMETAGTEGVTALMNKMTSFSLDEARLLSLARARERREMDLSDKYDEGRDEGERTGIEKGEKKGIIDSVVNVVGFRFGVDADELRLALQNKSLEELRELSKDSVVCESVEDFLAKLES